jgi:glutathione synthase/RimK-type ligase-like ATP-grasp enzyme
MVSLGTDDNRRVRVALATSERWPQLSPDDLDLIPEMARLGIDAAPAVWTDPSVDWSRFDLVVIRSCWDYHRRIGEFVGWLDRLTTPVANPREAIRWNAHKGYLLELGSKGIPIPETQLIRKGSPAPAFADAHVIIKPAISASANETHRFAHAAEAMTDLERLLRAGDVIVQEFVDEVISDGEWSLMFFDRHLSHAVKKAPKAGDFRVQQELGGSALAGDPPSRVLEAAHRALSAVDHDLLYARVDVVNRDAGAVLMELELIEPSLFFGTSEGSSGRFAAAVLRRAN